MRPWQLWGITPLLFHCSMLYAPAPARQCESDADCQQQPQLRGLSCDTQYGLCVSEQNALEPGCESTSACTEQNEGLPALCRYPGSPCVRLATPECPLVSGDWQAGDALVLGSVGPYTLGQPDHSAPQLEYVTRLRKALDLGVEEWQREVPEGLFSSQRPLAVVHCNSNGDPSVAQLGMEHLLRDIQVPLVFALSDIEQAALVEQALRSDVTLVCVECYARAQLPPVLEAGLVWRMLPALEDQAELAAWRVSDLERKIRAERGLGDAEPIRVAVWSDSGDAFDAFVGALHEVLRFNGGQDAAQNGSNYLEIRNADPRREIQARLSVARGVVAFVPDILVSAVNEDFTGYYLRMIEAEWPGAWPKPQYVTTSLTEELNQLAAIVGGDDDLRRRISGTGLFLEDQVQRNLVGFQTRYGSRYGSDPGRTQAAYDAWYAAALAIYSADAQGRLDGASIAAHFSRLTTGAAADVDPLALASARAYLAGHESIDLVGASTELDWDPISQRVRAEVALWCLRRDANGGLQLGSAGPRSTPAGTLGSYDCP